MTDYKQLYLTLLDGVEKAINTLIDTQKPVKSFISTPTKQQKKNKKSLPHGKAVYRTVYHISHQEYIARVLHERYSKGTLPLEVRLSSYIDSGASILSIDKTFLITVAVATQRLSLACISSSSPHLTRQAL